jgi:hypothetical protein
VDSEYSEMRATRNIRRMMTLLQLLAFDLRQADCNHIKALARTKLESDFVEAFIRILVAYVQNCLY